MCLSHSLQFPSRLPSLIDTPLSQTRVQRAAAADALFASLEEKYGKKSKKTKRAPPTDEEFEAIQAKMLEGEGTLREGTRRGSAKG